MIRLNKQATIGTSVYGFTLERLFGGDGYTVKPLWMLRIFFGRRYIVAWRSGFFGRRK